MGEGEGEGRECCLCIKEVCSVILDLEERCGGLGVCFVVLKGVRW